MNNKPKVKRIEIELSGKLILLDIEDARALFRELKGVFEPQPPVSIPSVWYPTPHYTYPQDHTFIGTAPRITSTTPKVTWSDTIRVEN